MTAARHLGDNAKADSLWSSLEAEGGRSPAHALFMGDTLVAWGYRENAAKLLWEAADRPDLSYIALGSLARLYQSERDAVGQYRAFSRLNSMRPQDRDIANNLAYFAALTDLGSLSHIEKVAEGNFNAEPGNLTYRSTYAFVLVWANQGTKAMEVLEPVAHDWKKSRAVAFSYGAALASVGRKDEAREVFESIDRKGLSPREIEWVANALR
jgi:tetratricopeptide (TPR) repeat protein